MARAMLANSKFSKQFWLEACTTAVYIKNRIILRAIQQFGLANANTTPLPISKTDIKLSEQSQPFTGQVVGTLIYAMVATRPDLSLAISRVCSSMASPTIQKLDISKKDP
jgi:hypothetical protein